MRKMLQIKDRHWTTLRGYKIQHTKSVRRRTSFQKDTMIKKLFGDRIKIHAPFSLNIYGKANRKYTLKFLSDIRKNIVDRKIPIEIDFSNTQYIVASAVILLTAELDRAKRIAGPSFNVRLKPSKTDRVNAIFNQIGVSNLCGDDLPCAEGTKNEKMVKNWRYATGIRINEQTTNAFENFEGLLSPTLRQGMWKSVSEAIVNSTEHAYLEGRGADMGALDQQRWWLFSAEWDSILTVAVCDMGIGIPRSLPLRWELGTLARIFDGILGKGEDSRAIMAALKVGASGTGDDHRGRGLPQIWHELRNHPQASVAIASNKGLIYWNGATNSESEREYADSIFGTIVTWSIKLTEQNR